MSTSLMRDAESGVEERFFASASDEALAEYVCRWRRYRFNIETGARIRVACQNGPFAFVPSPHLNMQ